MYPTRPIGPDDVQKSIPDFVIEAVNELINEKHKDGGFNILQSLIKDRIMSKTEQDFDWAWMDFEPIYRNAGWNVSYDKPAYCETYEAYFTFSKRK